MIDDISLIEKGEFIELMANDDQLISLRGYRLLIIKGTSKLQGTLRKCDYKFCLY